MNFETPPVLMQADPRVKAAAGKAAVMYGPVVYCAEGCDNTGSKLHELYLSSDANFEIKFDDTFKSNIIIADGFKKLSCGSLYSPVDSNYEKTKIKLIPFAYHANRGASDMMVWLNLK